MRIVPKSRAMQIIAAGFILLGSGIAAAAWHFRIYSLWDYQIFCAMEKECHPAWREFNFRRISPGADLTDVVNSTKPLQIDRYGDFVVLSYERGGFTGFGAVAYKGRLVEASARSCCWTKIFFDVRTEEEKNLQSKNYYEAQVNPILEQLHRELAEEQLKEAQDAKDNDNAP